MNLYEFEGKALFEKYGIKIPKGVVIRRGDNVDSHFESLNSFDVVVKAQVLSGKRGKNNAIRFCSGKDEIKEAVEDLFSMEVRGQYVASVRIEEKLSILSEHYVSITYDTNAKQPVLIYSEEGGMDIEDVDESKIYKCLLDISNEKLELKDADFLGESLQHIFQSLWNCFLKEDCRVVEINPLVKTLENAWVAADAKIALDDDAFFRHEDWETFEPRTMMGRQPTDREIAVQEIDKGEKYYQGTAGKYIEFDGDVALILNGGGASIANMDALMDVGLQAANYTEYSGNPPREKVYQLAKIVLSKPGLRGLWMCGVVANFTNMKETFLGIIDALDEVQPRYPIVVRRDGPESAEAFALVEECKKRNSLNMQVFGKETSMTESARILAEAIHKQ